jgi:hypothetical protein
MENRAFRSRLSKKVLCVALVACLVAVPVVAQDSSGESEDFTTDYNQGWLDGQADAEGSGVWILSGLLLGPIGIILPWVINPKVPGARLIGKSVGYVEGYTAGYRQKAKPKNFYYSLIGFGIFAVVAVVGTVLAVRTAESAADSCADSCSTSLGESCSENLNCSPDLGCSSQ